MVEIRQAHSVTTDSRLSQLLERYDQLINELSPRNATAVWELDSNDLPGGARLQLSDAYGRSCRVLSEMDLNDADRMLEKISQLVGDLVYQESENRQDRFLLAQLASFAPGRLCERFTADEPEIPLPSSEDMSCAVLFADISGFTSLTERLAQKGAVGAEELTAALNRYFGELINIVTQFGGDVLKFAGDALLATFEDRVAHADLHDATARAAAASVVIQNQLRDFPEVEGTKLSLKIALAAGDLRMLHVGGVFGRCELLMVGDPLKELGDANDLAGPGDIIAAKSLWSRIESLANGTPVCVGNYRIESLRQTPENFESDDSRGQSVLTNSPFRDESVAAMRGYIPAAIYARLAAGQTDWLGELRKVTVVFANLPGFNLQTPLQEAQRVMVELQQAVYHFEGSLNKLSVDDKGVSMLAGFGLPPVAHEDDSARAIGAALALRERINNLGWECSIGVATGRIFCGAYGNDDRREYTMIGDTVNTSARLMQAAQQGILCDQATYLSAESQFGFDTLEPLRMKGKSEPVACFRPLERRNYERRNSTRNTTIIGRESERQLFDRLLEDLRLRQQSSVLLLEGEAGIGKSHLVNAFSEIAEQRGCRILHGSGDAIEQSTPWFAWRSVIADLIGREVLSRDVEDLEQAICEQFELDDELQKLLPLLSSVLPLAWSDNEWTAQMKGAIRADNTNRLLIRLIAQAAQTGLLVLVLEDTHHFDSASRSLLRSVATSVQPLHVLASARPLSRPLQKDLAAVVGMASSHHIQLELMSADESVQLVQHLLEAHRLPRPVEHLIRNRTQGHPLHVEELAYALRDTQTVQVTAGIARLNSDLNEFEAREVSDSLEGVIVNRIDRLPPSQQLTLKVASVIGYEFPYPVLRDVFPLEQERAELAAHVEALNSSKLTRSNPGRPDSEHSFRSRTIRDVVYNLVLVKHRTELHREIALWIENQHRGELDGHYPRLAEHWQQAGELDRAIECLEHAGQNALEHNANQEAARFYRRMFELAGQSGEPIDPMRQARWHRRYGEALYRLGEIPAALQHLRTALRLFGHPDSESVVSQAMHGGVEIARQVFTRLRNRLFGPATARPSEALIESVRAYERLVEIQYQRTDMPAFMLATFRSLNLAERFGFSAELAHSYSSVSAMTSAMMLPRAAQRYTDRAERMALRVGDLATTAYVQTINSVHFICHGQWEAAGQTLEAARQSCTAIGDRRRWSEGAALVLNLASWSGDWDRLAVNAQELREAADNDLGSQVAMWAYGWLLWVGSARNPHSEQVHAAESDLQHWLDSNEELALADELLGRGGLLFARLRRGEWSSALEIADQIEDILGNAQPVAVYLLPVYAGLVDLYSALCVSQSPEVDSPEMAVRLRRMQRRLTIFSLLIPISGPLKCLCDGRRKLLKGRTASAHRSFRKGLRLSRTFRMPYFSAILEFELARIADTDIESRDLNDSARDRCRQLGIENPEVVTPEHSSRQITANG